MTTKVTWRENFPKTLVGWIGVDAGLCWIGDPCYVLPDEDDTENPGSDWEKFCDAFRSGGPRATLVGKRTVVQSFPYGNGSEGLGVCVVTGNSDGYYPVEADIEDGRVKSITVTFVEDEGDD